MPFLFFFFSVVELHLTPLSLVSIILALVCPDPLWRLLEALPPASGSAVLSTAALSISLVLSHC